MSPGEATRLAGLILHDERVALVPIEHLGASGMSAACARVLADERGWSASRIALFDAGFALYWTRSAALARRTRTWLAPRRRHVAVVADPLSVPPYASLLNTSAWLLYDGDLDPEQSDAELVAYLLVHGERLAHGREVTTAAIESAAWWLERSDEECAAFARAAEQSTRPDGEAFRELARGLGWLRTLSHERLRPAETTGGRPIKGTGLVVPEALRDEPERLAQRWRGVAEGALAKYGAAWCASDPAAVGELCDWLAESAPSVLLLSGPGRVVWDPETPAKTSALSSELAAADAVAVRSLREDLATIERVTRAFRRALLHPSALPWEKLEAGTGGYCTLDPERRLLAYDLREPGIDRFHGPPLPYARAMLAARAAHEWGHLVDQAGWIRPTVPPERFEELCSSFAGALDEVIAAAPERIRERTASDLAELASPSPGTMLARIALARLPDYRANLVVREIVEPIEAETYVRHNVRTLRPEYPPWRLWRMLVRYLYELQYLGAHLAMSSVRDPRDYLLASTWFDQDFIATGVLDVARFDALAAALGEICACHAVDREKLRFAAPRPEVISARET